MTQRFFCCSSAGGRGRGPAAWVSAGFTLIELMIVVAIVAVLASIAYPAYTSAVIKGKRGEGRTALVDLMQQQERYMTQTGAYGYNNLAIPEGGGAGIPFKMYAGDVPATPSYLLRAERCDAVLLLSECVRVIARPQFVDPEVNEISIASTGVKDCTGSKRPVSCWR